MNSIAQLIHGAIHHEVDQNKNPYLTLETIIQRLYKKIAQVTNISPYTNEKTVLFFNWHNEILASYETIRSSLSYDERACVERVLSKDSPHTSELIKFSTCWLKNDPRATYRLFAVDGVLGNHPRLYVQEAFSPRFVRHNDAVRTLYDHVSDPETVKKIVEKAFLLAENELSCPELEPEIEELVKNYMDAVGENEIKLVSGERKLKLQQQQPAKRKKTYTPVSPPGSPASPHPI